MNKYTNNRRGGVSPSSSFRPPSPSIRNGQMPVRLNIRPTLANATNVNNDIDRELLSQSADFDGPDYGPDFEVQSIFSSNHQSILHDLVLAQQQDRLLSSVNDDANIYDDDDQEDDEEIDHDVIVGDGTSQETDLTSFSGYIQTSIIDNKDFDIESHTEDISKKLSSMSDQSLGFIFEVVMKEMENRKGYETAISKGMSTAARAGLEGNISFTATKTGRRPSLENGERKSSPSLNKKTTTVKIAKISDGKPGSATFIPTVKKTYTNSFKGSVVQKPNKPKSTVGVSKKPTPVKGTALNVKDMQEESREWDFEEEMRECNGSPTILRSSADGLPSNDKTKNQQKANNRHGAAHPNDKMFKTGGPRYNPSPPVYNPAPAVQKSRDYHSVISKPLNFFTGKKSRSKKEKEDEDFIVVEAIKAKNAKRADIANSIIMSDDESSNGLSSFSISKSTAFDDRSVGSFSSKLSGV